MAKLQWNEKLRHGDKFGSIIKNYNLLAAEYWWDGVNSANRNSFEQKNDTFHVVSLN